MWWIVSQCPFVWSVSWKVVVHIEAFECTMHSEADHLVHVQLSSYKDSEVLQKSLIIWY